MDDEEKIREVIVSYLQKEGFRTAEAASGQEALKIVRQGGADLLVLDLMLPDMDGEQVCREIRRTDALPVLMLTAKASKSNQIYGLSLGADDYLTKPFDPRELVARVRAVMRRSDDSQLLADRVSFQNGHLEIDSLRQAVFCEGEPVSLTPIEYKLLIALARYPKRSFSRDELVDKIMGYAYDGDVRTIDQHVKNIRQKIEKDPKNPVYIQTVYGAGYRFSGELK